MDPASISDTLTDLRDKFEAGVYDGPMGRAAFSRRIMALKNKVFQWGDSEYYAIVQSDTVIGFCHRSSVTDVERDHPEAHFKPISAAEYKRLHDELEV